MRIRLRRWFGDKTWFDSGQRRPHPRVIGWPGTVAMAMGGSNQSLFLITALFAGQGDSSGQGSATIPLLLLGLLLSYAAAPGWTELVLMSPDKTGGIAAVCTRAFRPYGAILSTLTGTCYWWGWVPTCGVTALMSAAAIQAWCLPAAPVVLIAVVLVLLFTAVNLCGVAWVARIAVPVALASAVLAFASMIGPVVSGAVDWRQSLDWHITNPFPGWFGTLTSAMAGLYLIGFGAPAFEAATCHVGETVDPRRNVPRAVLISGAMAAVFFVGLPVVWLGVLGPDGLGRDLAESLPPTFAPFFGPFAKSAVIGFLMFNMFHGTLQPLAGAARTLAQLAEDGVAPRMLAWRLPSDAPWVATLATAGFAILFLLLGDPISLIAAANFTYLIGICLPSIAVWLLRRDAPDAPRLYRAPKWTIEFGLVAAAAWGCSALLGFEQFGLPTVCVGLLLAYSGAGLYAWRMLEDRWRAGLPGIGRSLHIKLTGAMLVVLALDSAGYILAVRSLPAQDTQFTVVLADIFVAVALLTITVGIVLPGMIAHSADQVSQAALRLARGTLTDFARAMEALGAGRLDDAHARVDIQPVAVRTHDELGIMAASFNLLQVRVKDAALGLDRAREGLSLAQKKLLDSNSALARTVQEQMRLSIELRAAKELATHDALHDGLTKLPNRTFLLRRLQRDLKERRPDLAFLFIDLDRFKMVNDSLGHLAGDELLSLVARRLRDALDDICREFGFSGHLVARLGGDEFMVVFEAVPSEQVALQAAEALLAVFDEPFDVGPEPIHCGASIGVTHSRFGYADPEDVLRDADLAMFKAKSLGKFRAELYKPALHDAAKTRLQLENDMRRALAEQQFVLNYQPIVRIVDQHLVGFEALVRWQHPRKGMIGPSEFICVAEETGIIVPLGLWVLARSCLKARAWGETYGWAAAPTVSVNLSPRQFEQADIVDRVRATLSETAVDPNNITLEITESGTIGDPDRAVEVLKALKATGIKFSIDDFGTGYSSLSYLHRLPLDMLKIDRSFISGMNKNRESRQVVKTILRLAESLGMKAVAEGVESERQLDDLASMGCAFGQGYFFAPPLSEADADNLVRLSCQAPQRTAAGQAA